MLDFMHFLAYSLREFFYLSLYVFIFSIILFILAYKKKKRILQWLFALCIFGGGLASYAYYVEPHILTTKKQDIYLSENTTNKVKIALVTDIHRGQFKTGIGIERIVRKLQTQEPDAVFILGDFLGNLARTKQELTYFNNIHVPIYAILGNHEAYDKPDVPSLEAALAENNIKVLRNKTVNITIKGKEFELIGLEDLEFKGFKGVQWSLLENQKDIPRIVLAHNPNTALFLKDAHQFDIMFSGHTHGGQVNIGIPTFDSATSKRFFILEGYKKQDARQYYVSAGIGMTILPIRFMRPPRIDIISLYD